MSKEESYFTRCDEEETNFTMVPNELLRNPNISTSCRWLIAYLLSHDKGWKIRIPYVIEYQNISKNKMYSLVNEAIEHGYLKREEFIVDGLKKYRYLVSRIPKFKKFLPCPQKQDLENEDTLEYQVKEEKEISKDIKKKEDASADAIALARFFVKKLKEKKPNFTKEASTSWMKEMDKLLKKRSFQEIEGLINFVVNDDFWLKNCLSPLKLLKHLDSLELQMKEKLKPKGKKWDSKNQPSTQKNETQSSTSGNKICLATIFEE